MSIMEIIIVFGPPLIVAIATIWGAKVTASNSQKKVKKEDPDSTTDRVLRQVTSFLAAGFSLAAVIMLYMLAIKSFWIFEDLEPRPDKTLADFPASPAGMGSEFNTLDDDARAILDNSGPKIMEAGKRIWSVGDVVYVGISNIGWVNQAFPKGDRDDDTTCILKPKGKLTVKGFSENRHSALLQYTVPEDNGGGTACDDGIYFFYALPNKADSD